MAPKQSAAKFTVPGMTTSDGTEVAGILQDRLNALTDLHLTLKHVHWNVVGPHFIAVHEMLDPQVDAVRAMTDATAERMATLGVAPVGTPGALVAARTWDDYDIGRAGALEHLGALDVVYAGVIESHRKAIDATEIDRSGHPGHVDRAVRPARALPLVRPGPPRELGRRAVDRRRDAREDRREEGRRRRQARQVVGRSHPAVLRPARRDRDGGSLGP